MSAAGHKDWKFQSQGVAKIGQTAAGRAALDKIRSRKSWGSGMIGSFFNQFSEHLNKTTGGGGGAAPRALEYTRKRKSLLGE